MTPKEEIQQWVTAHLRLSTLPNAPRSFDAWLAKHGTWFEQRAILPSTIVREKSRECYYNAWKLRGEMRKGKRQLTYCEGLMKDSVMPIPVLHGWLVDEMTGAVLDPSVNQSVEQFAYLGLRFDPVFAHKAWLELRSKELIGIVGNAWCLESVSLMDYLNANQREKNDDNVSAS